MAFEWLERFKREQAKPPDYAERTLAAYALGMKAKGPIVGVAIVAGPDSCDAARRLDPGAVYDPRTAPRLPLPDCPNGAACRCAYRPVTSYEREP
jgi:hypothetical protein